MDDYEVRLQPYDEYLGIKSLIWRLVDVYKFSQRDARTLAADLAILYLPAAQRTDKNVLALVPLGLTQQLIREKVERAQDKRLSQSRRVTDRRMLLCVDGFLLHFDNKDPDYAFACVEKLIDTINSEDIQPGKVYPGHSNAPVLAWGRGMNADSLLQVMRNYVAQGGDMRLIRNHVGRYVLTCQDEFSDLAL